MLLRFDTQEIQDELDVLGGGVTTARLELFVEFNAENWGPGRTVDIHRLAADWDEERATWSCGIDTDPTNQQPDCAPQWSGGSFVATPTDTELYDDTTGDPPNGAWVTFEVTADVSFFLADPSRNFGWVVKKTFEHQNGRVEYTSMEGTAGFAPRLVLAAGATATSTSTNTATPTDTPTRTPTHTPTDTLIEATRSIGRQLGAWIQYLRRSGISGSKHRSRD